jgi:hypothetical protein
MAHEIGERITFTNAKGETLSGVIETRNWSFSTLLSYVVRVGAVRYNVNARDYTAGHSF